MKLVVVRLMPEEEFSEMQPEVLGRETRFGPHPVSSCQSTMRSGSIYPWLSHEIEQLQGINDYN
jgi:hypothetical protein